MNRTAKHLISHNIKPSAQRIAIMSYLLDHPIHPTVDKIYNSLLPEMPTLSRTTVYNTLHILEKNDALVSLDIDSNNKRYDGNLMPHAHFICRVCGKIYDMPIPAEVISEVPGFNNFKIEAAKLYYKGVCEECQHTK